MRTRDKLSGIGKKIAVKPAAEHGPGASWRNRRGAIPSQSQAEQAEREMLDVGHSAVASLGETDRHPLLANMLKQRLNLGAVGLEWLLRYELTQAARYRRELTLVLVGDGWACCGARLLGGLVRRSDELFVLDSDAAILMSETAKHGALRAIARFKTEYLEEFDLRFAVAAYPNDGKSARGLLQVAHRRLEAARQGGFGAVVSAG